MLETFPFILETMKIPFFLKNKQQQQRLCLFSTKDKKKIKLLKKMLQQKKKQFNCNFLFAQQLELFKSYTFNCCEWHYLLLFQADKIKETWFQFLFFYFEVGSAGHIKLGHPLIQLYKVPTVRSKLLKCESSCE